MPPPPPAPPAAARDPRPDRAQQLAAEIEGELTRERWLWLGSLDDATAYAIRDRMAAIIRPYLEEA